MLLTSPVSAVPPEASVYHRNSPGEAPVAVNEMLVDEHPEFPIFPGAEGRGLIKSPGALVITSVARSPLIRQRYRPAPKVPVVLTESVDVAVFEYPPPLITSVKGTIPSIENCH